MSTSDPDLTPGTLLIAPPMMHDPNFRRTVVLLCEHGAEGSFGLVLNRPLAISLHEVMRGIGRQETSVSMGGPVQPDTLHFVHCHGGIIPTTIPLLSGIYWGGDFELLKVLVETGQTTPRDLRFFLGYAGWAASQLREEIDAGGWILARADLASIFPEEPGTLWRTLLRRLGGEYALLANFPEDPRMN
jgi:putative transcriptional regulator